jgi:hypothetical protein
MMKRQHAGTEFQYRSNGHDYYKTVVINTGDDSQVKGSRSLQSFTGSALARQLKHLQEDIDRGCFPGHRLVEAE